MPLNTQVSDPAVNGQANDLSARLNGGLLRIYDGVQPTNANTALGTQVLLATLTFNATAAPAAVSGLLTFNAITSATAGATGTAAWFRALNAAGTVTIMDSTVGLATSNCILTSVSIVSGGNVAISSFTHNVLKASAGL